MRRRRCNVALNLKEKKKPFLFLDLLSAVPKSLSVHNFSGKYGRGISGYTLSKSNTLTQAMQGRLKSKKISFFRFIECNDLPARLVDSQIKMTRIIC
jgi:hypothetical protein